MTTGFSRGALEGSAVVAMPQVPKKSSELVSTMGDPVVGIPKPSSLMSSALSIVFWASFKADFAMLARPEVSNQLILGIF